MAQYRIFDLCVRVSSNTKGDKQVLIVTKRPGGNSIPLTQWLCGPAVDDESVKQVLAAVESLLVHELNRCGGIQHVLM